MRLTRKRLSALQDKFHSVFCLVAAKPISEKWATCYNCHVTLRVVSHLRLSGFLDKAVSKHVPLGVCLEIGVPTNKLISIINFELSQHVILCLTCLGDSFLATDGSLFTRCSKCLSFFYNVEPAFDGMYWEGFQGTEYDMHVVFCKKQEKTRRVPAKFYFGHGPSTYHNPRNSSIKPFLLRKDQIK